jgi:monothiol glutaredoxin
MSDGLRARIKEIVEHEPIVLFMKGTPEWIACGNSGRALAALKAVGAPVTTVDILAVPTIRQELTSLYGWPTIPQVFVNGDLIGGADITQELAEAGQLEQEISSRLGDGWRGGEDKVLEVSGGSDPFRVVAGS